MKSDLAEFIVSVSEPIDASGKGKEQKIASLLTIAVGAIVFLCPILILYSNGRHCGGSSISTFFEVGLYPSLKVGMPRDQFCPALTMRIVGAYSILSAGVVLGGAIYLALRRRGRVLRDYAGGTLVALTFLASVWSYQIAIKDAAIFSAEFSGRFEELASMRKIAKEKGMTAEVEWIDARLKKIIGEGAN